MDSRPSQADIELCPPILMRTKPEQTVKSKENFVIHFLHSFEPQERASSPLNGTAHPVEGDTSPLNRALKGRHLQFIAIGGSIGAGLFIGCGKALAIGGPGWLLIAFTIVGIMLLCVMHALGELAAVYPISGICLYFTGLMVGSFAVYSTRFIDKSWGFAMGWNYAMQWLAVLPFVIAQRERES
jgi:amino acid permease